MSPPASPRGDGGLGLGCGPLPLNASKVWGPTGRTALEVASELAMDLEELGGRGGGVRKLDGEFLQWVSSAVTHYMPCCRLHL